MARWVTMWIDGFRGDDANDGLSEGAPKRTLVAATQALCALREEYGDDTMVVAKWITQESIGEGVWRMARPDKEA